MNIVDINEKWILNIISILFYVVMINFSRSFNDDMIICNIILFFRIFNSFRHFKKNFETIFWNLHCCSKIVFFMLHYYFVFSIANFHVHLLFVENTTFAFQTLCFLNYVNIFLKSFKICSLIKFDLKYKLFYYFFNNL